jgi:hypothetical protein
VLVSGDEAMTLQRRGPLVESVKFGMVRVYLEDIEEIFQVLEKLAKSVRIQADDFVATDPQDLVDIPAEVIDSLTLVATEPSITVTLSKYVASAEATDADMTTLGALKRIEEIVRKRNRPFKKFIWSISTPPKQMRLGDFLVTIVMAGLFAGFVVLLLKSTEVAGYSNRA